MAQIEDGAIVLSATMRERILGILMAVSFTLPWQKSSHAAEPSASTALPTEINRPYPVQFDLVQEPQGFTYRLSQSEAPLYLSSADPPGKSLCNDDCAQKWIPVIADANAVPMGNWTLIVRQDGRRQWAFKNQPVYISADDGSNKNAVVSGTFHLMPHFR